MPIWNIHTYKYTHAQRHVLKTLSGTGVAREIKGDKSEICDDIRCNSESGWAEGSKARYSEEDKPWQAWSTYVKKLRERMGIILMRKSRKDVCGCRIVVLWGCSIYSRDMGLRQQISVSAP